MTAAVTDATESPDVTADRPWWSRLRTTGWAIPLLTVVVGTVVRIPQLAHNLNEQHAFRQTQTAMVARAYARSGVDLLRTPLLVFGPDSDAPMEMPLSQAIASLVNKAGLGDDMSMRLVGLIGFQAAALLVTVLALRWHGRSVAAVAAVLFQFTPFALAWGGAALIEFPAIAFALGMVVGLDRWFTHGSVAGLVGGSISAWLAFLVKSTTAPGWCLLLLASAVSAYLLGNSWRRIVGGVLAGPAIGLGLGLAWTRYADGIKNDDALTRPLTSESLMAWNFGSADQRLDPAVYAKIVGRIGSEIAGPLGFGLVLAVVGIVLAARWIPFVRSAGWLATAAFSPLVFLNLYYVHNYYLGAIFPAVVVATAIGVVAVAERVERDVVTGVALVGMITLGTALLPVGRRDVEQWYTSADDPDGAVAIAGVVSPSEMVVMTGCNMDPMNLYYADRVGLMLWVDDVDEVWSNHDIADYSYLWSCSTVAEPSTYLPAGWTTEPTTRPELFRLVAPAS